MKVLIDNNVILDVFQNRKPFVEHSAIILRMVETRQIKGFITANSITDIYYILRKHIQNKQKLYSIINNLLSLIDIIDVTAADVKKAVISEYTDFEDELINVCAQRAKMDYIVTRNHKDFKNSNVTALTPEQFISEFYKKL